MPYGILIIACVYWISVENALRKENMADTTDEKAPDVPPGTEKPEVTDTPAGRETPTVKEPPAKEPPQTL
jgi:hypothetical protein